MFKFVTFRILTAQSLKHTARRLVEWHIVKIELTNKVLAESSLYSYHLTQKWSQYFMALTNIFQQSLT